LPDTALKSEKNLVRDSVMLWVTDAPSSLKKELAKADEQNAPSKIFLVWHGKFWHFSSLVCAIPIYE